jgi:4-amino-4-deoxy-L-arabinose transferase-like glycosyltransferase
LREGVSAVNPHRPGVRWLAAVLVCFCLPLFVNLGTSDLDNDEAIYSFAVDRMVATGDWLVPRAIPHGDAPFLEKPPLKFWMVALPMRAGWLPPDEFGMRFWDAVFGAASFVYVFLIGTWFLNPVCGFIAVLLLFAHAPLVYNHGLRSNTMDSAVVLAYCGGIYHYLRWIAPFDVRTTDDERSGVRTTNDKKHVWAVALYFVLGFMTKFVAALFLPMILGLTALVVPQHRRALARGWRTWAVAAVIAIVLIAPWFVFATVRFGGAFWQTILGMHVYQRFTSSLDPGHLHPWHYYLGQMFAFWESGALVLITAGFALVAAWTARRYAPSFLVLVIWLVLPLAVISAVTSKLYHYAFPLLPALALMGAYFAALVPAIGWASFDRALDRAYARAAAGAPRLTRFVQHRAVRVVLLLALAVTFAAAAGGVVFGRIEFKVGTTELASAGVLRPALWAFVFGVLLMPPRRFRHWLLVLLVGGLLPVQGYRDSLALLGAGAHPRRSVSSCISALQAGSGAARGLRVTEPVETISHSVFYYFDRIQPWGYAPNRELPALVRLPWPASSNNAVDVGEGLVVTLPPTYAACASASVSR